MLRRVNIISSGSIFYQVFKIRIDAGCYLPWETFALSRLIYKVKTEWQI